MYKLYALWTAPRPGGGGALERPYTQSHLPLAAPTAGGRKLVATRTSDALGGGEATLHRITELWFDDRAAMEAAESSPEGQATAKDAVEIQESFGAKLTSVAAPTAEHPLGS